MPRGVYARPPKTVAKAAQKPQEPPSVPDLKSETAAAAVTADAYSSGSYKMQPESEQPGAEKFPGRPAPHHTPVKTTPPVEETAAEPVAEGPDRILIDDPHPTPFIEPDTDDASADNPFSNIVRMTHPDDATVDGIQRDEDGAYWVPHQRVEEMKSHGFVVEYLPDPEGD